MHHGARDSINLEDHNIRHTKLKPSPTIHLCCWPNSSINQSKAMNYQLHITKKCSIFICAHMQSTIPHLLVSDDVQCIILSNIGALHYPAINYDGSSPKVFYLAVCSIRVFMDFILTLKNNSINTLVRTPRIETLWVCPFQHLLLID